MTHTPATNPFRDETESSLRGAFITSAGMHVLLLGGLVIAAQFSFRNYERWGDPNATGGGAVDITPVNAIQLPTKRRGDNPLFSDTESQVQPSPEKAPPSKTREAEEAIALKSRNTPKRVDDKPTSPQKYQPKDARDNEIRGTGQQAGASPLITSKQGSGDIGASPSGPFGNRFADYAQRMQQKIASNWRTENIDAGLNNAPPVTIGFEILRDGTVRAVKVLSSSGNFSVDMSAQRAVLASNPLPPLPAGYSENSANVELKFSLKR